MSFDVLLERHPLLLIVTDLRGYIVEATAYAKRTLVLELETPLPDHFYEEDGLKVVQLLQACEPIDQELLRIEVSRGRVKYVCCTVTTESDRLYWSLEDVNALIETQEQLQSLKMLPKEYGHDINNFLTVIGSAAESIQMDITDSQLLEDVDAILSMSERAGILTRRFMHLGRKSMLANEVVNVQTVFAGERARLERLMGRVFLQVDIEDGDVNVFASVFALRNIWMALALCFEEVSCSVHISVQNISHHFANKVLGTPAGTYVLFSIVEEGFDHDIASVLSTKGLVGRERDELQFAWEALTRCRGSMSHHQNQEHQSCITVYLPWVRPPTK